MSTRPNAGTKGVPRAEREHQIVAAASLRFGSDGFAATNLADVAEAVGISKPLIYNYFGSKEGLYSACVDDAGDLLSTEIERIARGGAVGLERGLLTLAGMFELLEDRRHVWSLLHDPTAPTEGALAQIVATHADRINKLAREGVHELLANAGITDELDVSAMTATWLGIVDSFMNWWVEHPEESARSMTDRVARLAAALQIDLAGGAS